METIYLNDELSKINIEATTADVQICSDDCQKPRIVFNPDFFDVQDEKKFLVIKEKQNTPTKAVFNGKNIIGSVTGGSNIIQINGNTIIQNGVKTKKSDTLVKLFLNSEVIYQLEAGIVSGEISVDDLKFSDLKVNNTSGDVSLSEIDALNVYVKSISGDVSLKNIDILTTLIESVSGDIDIDVAESEINYSVDASSVCGRVRQISTEVNAPSVSNTKRKIKVKQVSGDTYINFKGKRQ